MTCIFSILTHFNGIPALSLERRHTLLADAPRYCAVPVTASGNHSVAGNEHSCFSYATLDVAVDYYVRRVGEL
jgi:hypothetical protein